MSQEEIKAFQARILAEPALRQELMQQAHDMAAVIAVAQREGFRFSEADLQDFLTAADWESGRELDDAELEEVAGAGWGDTWNCVV